MPSRSRTLAWYSPGVSRQARALMSGTPSGPSSPPPVSPPLVAVVPLATEVVLAPELPVPIEAPLPPVPMPVEGDAKPADGTDAPKGVEVLARGPVHEAFAAPTAEPNFAPMPPILPVKREWRAAVLEAAGGPGPHIS
jgi:hypothetical protein